MSTLVWLMAGALAALALMLGCRVAVNNGVTLARASGAPPFLVGVTLFALGTDLPEIVNSLVASYLGHGDVNIGDSVGSVFTQGTLVLGLFPFLGASLATLDLNMFRRVPLLTIAALALGAVLCADDHLGRTDALLLIGGWLLASVWLWRVHPPRPADAPERPTGLPALVVMRHVGLTLLALALVGAAAAVLVKSVVAVAAGIGVPEYLVSFFVAALGTSLPEVAVEVTALRRGEARLAAGDVLGSCLIDASLSIAAGPLFFATAVTGALAIQGATVAALAMLIIAVVVPANGRLSRPLGVLLLGAYAAGFWWLTRTG